METNTPVPQTPSAGALNAVTFYVLRNPKTNLYFNGTNFTSKTLAEAQLWRKPCDLRVVRHVWSCDVVEDTVQLAPIDREAVNPAVAELVDALREMVQDEAIWQQMTSLWRKEIRALIAKHGGAS